MKPPADIIGAYLTRDDPRRARRLIWIQEQLDAGVPVKVIAYELDVNVQLVRRYVAAGELKMPPRLGYVGSKNNSRAFARDVLNRLSDEARRSIQERARRENRTLSEMFARDLAKLYSS